MSGKSSFWALTLVAAACVLLVAAEPIAAQRTRTRSGKGGRTRDKTRGVTDRSWSEAGSHRSKIIKFAPAKAGEDEEIIGTLYLLPLEPNGKRVSVHVRRGNEPGIELGGHQFSADELESIPWKGLICSVSWGYPEDDPEAPKKKKKKHRELRSFAFETLEVVGKVDQIEDDLIKLKVVPKNDRQWPSSAKPSNRPNNKPANNKPKRIPRKTIKVLIIDEVTKFVDANRQPLDLGDFEADQEIEATVAWGKRSGIIVMLLAPGIETEPKLAPDEGKTRRGEKGPQQRTRRGMRRGTRRGMGG
jgi:hypothetical protein